MQTSPFAGWRGFVTPFFIAAAIAALPATGAPMVAKPEAANPVTVTDSGRSWTLDNGIVKAVIDKRNGAMDSLIFRGVDTMGHDQGQSGYWEQDPSSAAAQGALTDAITIDPSKNGGARAEVSIKGVTGGKFELTPGAPGGGTYCDMEVRYSMGRGESGVYVYAIFTHPASYRAGGVGSESRYITKINQAFDWISVDADRNMLQCSPRDWGTGVVVHAKEQRIMSTGPYKNSVEHKYNYSGVQYQTHAYGWSSTKNHMGIWFINPTIEYLSGGPTKLELDCHFGDNDNPDPIILDYWEGGHYDTGSRCNVAAGEDWNKVIGPIFVYVNGLANPEVPSQADMATFAATAGNPTVPPAWTDNANALYQDAMAEADKQKAEWPFDWVNGVDYPHKDQRGNVSGQIVLDDPLAPAPISQFTHLTVGLAHPDPAGAGGGGGRGGGAPDGIHDAKYYQFWNDGGADGKFTITNVRPGQYTLHAYADGVLGEFAQANINVEPGRAIDLGRLDWKPVRYGRQVWDIGYPDRTGGKFFKGDGPNYWLWGWNLRYALLFPNDVTYTIGKSDYRKDWFFEEVPHATDLSFVNPDAKDPANQRFGWVKGESLTQYPQTNTRGPWAIYGRGRATTWTVKFNMDSAGQGQAALRVAVAGVNAINQLPVTLNGQSIGAIGGGAPPENGRLINTNTIRYNSDKGLWQQRTLRFAGTLLKQGENEMQFTVPAGDLQSGVVWDYLRLELADNR
jgi:rhamnogalacturonan endolyase